MIDLKQYSLALQFKWVKNLFDKNYKPAWKLLENCCCKENSFFGLLRSNVKFTNIFISNLAYLRFTRNTILTLKSILQ